MEQQKRSDIKILCDKSNIVLYKLADEYEYQLNFNIKNYNYNMRTILEKDIYQLISNLNKDLIENIKTIKKNNDGSSDLQLSFNSFGKELGLRKKIMYINVITEEMNNTISYISKDIGNYFMKDNDSDIIYNKYSILTINFLTNHEAEICQKFNIDIKEDLPIFMQNMIGIIMKNVFKSKNIYRKHGLYLYDSTNLFFNANIIYIRLALFGIFIIIIQTILL